MHRCAVCPKFEPSRQCSRIAQVQSTEEGLMCPVVDFNVQCIAVPWLGDHDDGLALLGCGAEDRLKRRASTLCFSPARLTSAVRGQGPSYWQCFEKRWKGGEAGASGGAIGGGGGGERYLILCV